MDQETQISICAAVTENGVMGVKGKIPWNLQNDKTRLAMLVTGKDVICTWNGYEDLWANLSVILCRARKIFVLTKRHSEIKPTIWKSPILLAGSLNEALTMCGSEEIMVLGAFDEAIKIANRIYFTRVHVSIYGDAFFPEIDSLEWETISTEKHPADSRNQFSYTFYTLERLEQKEINPCPLCIENRKKFFNILKEERYLDLLRVTEPSEILEKGSFIAASKLHTGKNISKEEARVIAWLRKNGHGEYKPNYETPLSVFGHSCFVLTPP